MGDVERLFICRVHRFPMDEVEQAEAVADTGFRKCIHGRHGSKRQVSIIDAETLELLGVAPGLAKENITTRGLDMKQMHPGQRLRIGEALLEVTIPCEPCSRMDDIRAGLREELRERRGWMCRVVETGNVRRGDGIEILNSEPETKSIEHKISGNKTVSRHHHGVRYGSAGDDGSRKNAGIVRHPA
jgi:MOSC domain-containing protein YiiM